MNEYDVVKILVNKGKIKKGSIGTILEVWDGGAGFEVEFLDDQGYVIDCICVERNELELVEKYNGK